MQNQNFPDIEILMVDDASTDDSPNIIKNSKTELPIIGKKILRHESLLPENIDYIKKNWVVGWHGTKFEFLESIMMNIKWLMN